MDTKKTEVVTAIKPHIGAILFAAEVAWNLREWLREATHQRTLQPVLQSLLPRIRAQLELSLIDNGLSGLTTGLPDGSDLTAASFIAFVERLEFTPGVRFSLRHAQGKPPLA